MFYDTKAKGELDKNDKRKERIKLRRDLLAKKDLLRREEARLNKLEFDERSVIKKDESAKAEALDRENKLKRVADEIRLLEEDIRSKKKVESRLNDEIKNLNRGVANARIEKEGAAKNIARVRSEVVRLAEEVKKLEGEVKSL